MDASFWGVPICESYVVDCWVVWYPKFTRELYGGEKCVNAVPVAQRDPVVYLEKFYFPNVKEGKKK